MKLSRINPSSCDKTRHPRMSQKGTSGRRDTTRHPRMSQKGTSGRRDSTRHPTMSQKGINGRRDPHSGHQFRVASKRGRQCEVPYLLRLLWSRFLPTIGIDRCQPCQCCGKKCHFSKQCYMMQQELNTNTAFLGTLFIKKQSFLGTLFIRSSPS